MEKRVVALTMTVFLLVAMYFLSKEAAVYTMAQKTEEKRIVVIDVGHGGNDPGKVGVNQVLEKDINLQVALKLEMFLQQSDLTVILTRHDDMGLYDEDASNKKVQDMRRRAMQRGGDPNASIIKGLRKAAGFRRSYRSS